jgi:hypothetical protein
MLSGSSKDYKPGRLQKAVGPEVIILAVDPGPLQSAFVEYDTKAKRPLNWLKAENQIVLSTIGKSRARLLAVEMIASYGMPVGKDTFQTCVYIGRFIERWSQSHDTRPRLVYRKAVKLHLCGSMRAKDANVRQALIDLFGPGKDKAIGLKASPGPLYRMTGDCWAALGVAVTTAHRLASTNRTDVRQTVRRADRASRPQAS